MRIWLGAGGRRRCHRLGDRPRFAPGAVFKIAFVVFTTFISVKMLFVGDRWNFSNHLPGRALLALYGFVIGLVSSLVGVSGGAVSNAVLTLHGQTDAARGGDLGRHRRADHHRRRHRLHDRRLAASWRTCRRCRSASSR